MVLGLFSKEAALKRAIKTAQNKLAQSEDRRAALEKLAASDSDEALLALCNRFSFVYDKSIQDLEEKEFVVESLVKRGDKSLTAITRYMTRAQYLGYPLTVLGRIAKGAKALEAIDAFLAEEPPGYTRDPKRRIDVIEWLAEWDGASDEEIAQRVLPYLADFDENVRFKAIEATSQKPTPAAGEPLARALVRTEEESARIRQRAAEVLADHGLELGEHKSAIAALLETHLTGFKMHKDKLQRK